MHFYWPQYSIVPSSFITTKNPISYSSVIYRLLENKALTLFDAVPESSFLLVVITAISGDTALTNSSLDASLLPWFQTFNMSAFRFYEDLRRLSSSANCISPVNNAVLPYTDNLNTSELSLSSSLL